MTRRALWKSAILAGLAAIAPLVTSSTARADIIVTITDTGPGGVTAGPTTLVVGAPTDNGGAGIASPPFTGMFGGFFITNGSAGESQNALFSQAFTTALNIVNTTGAARTLNILIEANRFTAPVPQATVQSSFSGTSVGANTGSLRSSVGATVASNPQALQSPPLTPSFNDTIFGSASGLAAPFSIFQSITFTIAAFGQVNFTARTILTAVPEPATVAMALTAVPLVGIGAVLRRRRARA